VGFGGVQKSEMQAATRFGRITVEQARFAVMSAGGPLELLIRSLARVVSQLSLIDHGRDITTVCPFQLWFRLGRQLHVSRTERPAKQE
jgi:hypothetical protein